MQRQYIIYSVLLLNGLEPVASGMAVSMLYLPLMLQVKLRVADTIQFAMFVEKKATGDLEPCVLIQG